MSARNVPLRLLLLLFPLVMVLLGTAGCGKRGALYLPPQVSDEVPATQQDDAKDGEQQAPGTGS